VGVMCIAPYSETDSGCHDVPLPSRSIGTTRSVTDFIVIPDIAPPCCMFIPGAMDALGNGVAGPIGMPGAMVACGFMDGDGVAGPIVIPGIGAIVGVGEGFAAFGAGVAFFAGAGVAIGIPGMGAIVGWAAKLGETVTRTKKAAMLRRVASKSTSRARLSVLQYVVHIPENRLWPRGFKTAACRITEETGLGLAPPLSACSWYASARCATRRPHAGEQLFRYRFRRTFDRPRRSR
jgi:hypothetical protein